MVRGRERDTMALLSTATMARLTVAALLFLALTPFGAFGRALPNTARRHQRLHRHRELWDYNATIVWRSAELQQDRDAARLRPQQRQVDTGRRWAAYGSSPADHDQRDSRNRQRPDQSGGHQPQCRRVDFDMRRRGGDMDGHRHKHRHDGASDRRVGGQLSDGHAMRDDRSAGTSDDGCDRIVSG